MKLSWRKLLVVAGVIQLLLAVVAISYFVYIRSGGRAEKTLGSVVNDAVPTSSPSPIAFIPSVVTPAQAKFDNSNVEFVPVAAMQQLCATAHVQGPPNGLYRAGDNLRLAVRITGAPAGAKFEYRWSVQPGVITSGQGTARIVVDTTTAPSGLKLDLQVSSPGLCINQSPTWRLRALPEEDETTTPPKPAVKTFTGRVVWNNDQSPASGLAVYVACKQGHAVASTGPGGRFRLATDLRGECKFTFTDAQQRVYESTKTLKDGAYDLGDFTYSLLPISGPSPAQPSPSPSPTQSQPTQSPIATPTPKPGIVPTSAATTGEFVVTWPRALGPNEEGTVSITYTPPANGRFPLAAEGFNKVEALVKPTNLQGLSLIDSREPTYRRLDNNQLVWNYQVKAGNDDVSELSCDTEAQLRLTNTESGQVVDLTSVQLGQASIQPLPVRSRTILNSGMLLVPTGAGTLGLGVRKKKRAKCFFRAAMDDQVIVNDLARIEVTVGREGSFANPMPLAQAVAEAAANVDLTEKLTLKVEPVSNYKVVGSSQIDLDPADLRSPKTCEFVVQATDLGEGEVDITAYQHQTMLVTLELKSQIVSSLEAKPARSEAEGIATESEPLKEPLNQLLITKERHGEKVSFKYQLISQAVNVINDWVQPLDVEPREYVDTIYAKIERFRKESNTYTDPQQQNDYFNRKLYSYGGELFDQLFPDDLKKVLWSGRHKIDSIWVISTEPFIPWEMVCLKDPEVSGGATKGIFFAELGLIRWLKKTTYPPIGLKIRKGRALYVIPEYVDQYLRLPEAEAERVFLRDNFQAVETAADPLSILDVLATPGKFDLLHFACHGKVALDKISDGCLLLQDRLEDGVYAPPRTLDPTDVGQGSNLTASDNQPLITVNACQAGRSGYLLSGMGGFAQSFVEGGAGAFVGTLWSIGDRPARTFTETLYRQLLSGETLCRATVEARKQAKGADPATWLAYVVYGHPHMRLK